MQFHDKTGYVWMGILPLKKRVNRDKCSFATKQRMFGVFAIEEPGSLVPALYATLVRSHIIWKYGSMDLEIQKDLMIPKFWMIQK